MTSILDRAVWTKQLRAWYLYDFAIALPTVVLSFYFAQWVTVDKGYTDFWFALPFIIATAILIFLSPVIGAYGDRTGKHHSVFIVASIVAGCSAILVWVFARYLPSAMGVVLALCAYGLFQFFSQLAAVPYATFIKYIAPEKDYGTVSGVGYASHALGQGLGVLLAVPFALGLFIVLGPARIAPLLLPALAFLILAIPAFIALRIPSQRTKQSRAGFFTQTVRSIRDAKQYPGVQPLLLSFYLFSDAIASMFLFAAIYLQKVLGVSDAVKAYLFLIVIGGILIGSFVGGLLSNRFGHRRTLIASLVGAALTIFAMAVAHSQMNIAMSFPLFGVFYGASHASSRSLYASLIPTKESGKYFGLYTFSERFASIIGPALWGLVIWSFRDAFPMNYRYAVIAMGLLVALSILPVLSVVDGRTVVRAREKRRSSRI